MDSENEKTITPFMTDNSEVNTLYGSFNGGEPFELAKFQDGTDFNIQFSKKGANVEFKQGDNVFKLFVD